MSIVVKHSSSLKPYKLSFPINWLANPYDNRNWLHHFNSLRWLSSEKDLEKVEKTLRDFYNFHCVKKNKNPYYSGRRGDHTAAIRLGVLLAFKDRFSSIDSSSGVGICERLVKEEIRNLHSEKLYRPGHNHGLMVDLALMRLVLDHPEYKKRVDLELVLNRSAKTLDAMWHASGLTKEHSVSYQEYNLPLTVEYFELLEKLNVEPLASVSLENVVDESRRFLGYALKASGEYIPLGDSFRLPNEKILNKVFGQGEVKSAHELLMPFSEEEGVYGNRNFFIFRKTVNGRKVHFAATCCWDSHNHKQNDELSFCLEVDGVTIFDDPGYTEFLPWEEILNLKSEGNHSTIKVKDREWSSTVGSNHFSEIAMYDHDNSGFVIEMHASRVAGYKFSRRIELKNNFLHIDDKIYSESEISVQVESEFIFNNQIDVRRDSDSCYIAFCKGEPVAKLKCLPEIESLGSELNNGKPYVLQDRKYTGKTCSVVFSVGQFTSPLLELKFCTEFL